MSKSSLKSLASIALESERIEEEQVVAQQQEQLQGAEVMEPVTYDEPELVEIDVEIRDSEDELDGEQSEAVAFEQLMVYHNELERQIKSKTVSMESIAMIQMGVQNIYAAQGVRLRPIAQESNMTAEAYGQIVMESIFGAIGNNMVLPIKRWKDRITDLFRSTASMSAKYRDKLVTARQELEQKKHNFQGAAEVNMHELWGFFSTDAGQATDIVHALQQDAALSKYILVEYPGQVLKAIQALTQLVGSSKFSEPEAAKRAFLTAEKLQHPADLFNKQFITGEKKPFLGVTGIDIKVGGKRKVLAVGGAGLPKLAELASVKSVRETSSMSHTAKNLAGKIGGKFVGSVAQGASIALSKNAKVTADQTAQAISFGEEYVTNVEQYKKIEPQLVAALEAMDQAFDKGMKEVSAANNREIKAAFDQIWWYAVNLCEAAFQPAGKEVGRSLRGARFTAYFARRAIFHKSNKSAMTSAA